MIIIRNTYIDAITNRKRNTNTDTDRNRNTKTDTDTDTDTHASLQILILRKKVEQGNILYTRTYIRQRNVTQHDIADGHTDMNTTQHNTILHNTI